MSDLNEVVKTVTRKTWDRANKIRITNDYGQYPTITFEIQTATTDDGVLIGTTPKSLLDVAFDPTASYPLINPMDNSIIAPDGGSHMMLQIQLYSLFKNKVAQELGE